MRSERFATSMSIRQRTTKLVAKRHDLNYFKRMSPIRAWQWWLACGALIVALVWFIGNTFVRGGAVLSAGPMSSSHTVFGGRCELCHVPVISQSKWTPSFGMRRHVSDSACLQCHVTAPHHAMESKQNPTCSSCHIEHTGSMHLAAVADSGCTQCHAKLESRSGVLRVASNITSFAGNHPEFQPLRTATNGDKNAATALVFNHAEHMKPGLHGPQGLTSLQCSSCHTATLRTDGRQGSGMAAVSFEKSCHSCHSLQFDRHVQTEAPHKTPAEVRVFVTQSITAFAQLHPQVVADEIRSWPQETPLPGRAAMPAPHNQQEWVADSVMRSEAILWREKCGLCHKTDVPFSSDKALPVYQAVKQPELWFSSAMFSHPAHQSVDCAECHVKALSSTSEHDQLMPSIATCRRCHDGRSSPQGPALASGHAESGCFLCHVYHGPETAMLTGEGLALDDMLKR
jgi:hypothetical protein